VSLSRQLVTANQCLLTEVKRTSQFQSVRIEKFGSRFLSPRAAEGVRFETSLHFWKARESDQIEKLTKRRHFCKISRQSCEIRLVG
jgi:hypothetical protein